MLQSNILGDVLNMSDHRVVTCNFNVHLNKKFVPLDTETNIDESTQILDFTNQTVFYNNRITIVYFLSYIKRK